MRPIGRTLPYTLSAAVQPGPVQDRLARAEPPVFNSVIAAVSLAAMTIV
jgi:hypothetical protein